MDDRLDEAARALAERLPEIDASLDDRVMAQITRRTDAPTQVRTEKPGFLRLLVEPRSVRVRPLWAGLAAAAVLTLLLVPRGGDAPASVASTPAVADTVYVRFQISAPAAQNVSVAGSFNNWDAAELTLRRTADGSWEATVPLPVGEHRYQFVVDGRRWLPDPSAQSQVEDGFGGTNSVIVVGPKGVVRS